MSEQRQDERPSAPEIRQFLNSATLVSPRDCQSSEGAWLIHFLSASYLISANIVQQHERPCSRPGLPNCSCGCRDQEPCRATLHQVCGPISHVAEPDASTRSTSPGQDFLGL